MFAHSRTATAEVVGAVREACPLPLWVKLSPNVADLTGIAGAAVGAGAEAITVINTVLGMSIDVEQRRPVLGAGGGGSVGGRRPPGGGPCRVRLPSCLPGRAIVGVGGVMRGVDAVELHVGRGERRPGGNGHLS